MLRLLVFLLAVTALAVGVARFADAPGSVTVTWLGYEIETSAIVAVLALLVLLGVALAVWSGLRYVLTRPAALRRQYRQRQERRGREALSQGLIAIGAGDRDQAEKSAALAHRKLSDEPLTGLLRAQTAQLRGDRGEARRLFEAMAEEPETELLGLRGLFLEARREGEMEAARQFAERAAASNPDLAWGVNALFELQCRAGDWEGALKTLGVARRQKHIDRETTERRRAVLLTAQAKEAEDSDIDRARELALEAHRLAPGLVPAAELAGRLLVTQGNTSRARRILQKAWERSPHPDLALAYAHLRPGDSPRERLKRVRALTESAPSRPEGPVAVASAAIEAREWTQAREALAPLLDGAPTARVCALMARIEGGETGDQGRVREWLSRAVRAPRDPAWTADGVVSAEWAPVSPVTGALDAFEWRVPVESIGTAEAVPAEEEPALPARAALPGSQAEAGPAPEVETETETKADAAPDSPPRAEGGAPPAPEPGTSEPAAPEPEETGPQQPRRDEAGTRAAEEDKKEEAEAGGKQDRQERDETPPPDDTPPREPEIFVPPRAPDDPGPDAEEGGEESRGGAYPYPPRGG